ncbi:hypothetical protein ACVWW4_003841 [Bradyrhizobium sp. LB7.1]
MAVFTRVYRVFKLKKIARQTVQDPVNPRADQAFKLRQVLDAAI